MTNIKTIFEAVHPTYTPLNETFAVSATGQEAASAALNEYPNKVILLKGFLINEEFKPVDLTDHWNRTSVLRNRNTNKK